LSASHSIVTHHPVLRKPLRRFKHAAIKALNGKQRPLDYDVRTRIAQELFTKRKSYSASITSVTKLRS